MSNNKRIIQGALILLALPTIVVGFAVAFLCRGVYFGWKLFDALAIEFTKGSN